MTRTVMNLQEDQEVQVSRSLPLVQFDPEKVKLKHLTKALDTVTIIYDRRLHKHLQMILWLLWDQEDPKDATRSVISTSSWLD